MTTTEFQVPNEDVQYKLYSELQQHLYSEYQKTLKLDSIKDSKLNEWINKADLRFWSHFNRICNNMQVFKHSFLLMKTKYICTSFKVSMDSMGAIYAYMYSEYDEKTKKFEDKYFCYGPTFKSQDGEYRHRFLPWQNLQAVQDKYRSTYDRIEKLVLSKLESNDIILSTDIYYPLQFMGSERMFENHVNSSRAAIKLYMMCWSMDFFNIQNGIMYNHANPAYRTIIYQPDDIPVYEEILGELGHLGYDALINRITKYYVDVNEPDRNLVKFECGQKIFPMTIFESMKIDDINFAVWREIYITNLCSDLVLNLITPSFPFINNWFYIQNTHPGLFDNAAMHEKYEHSEIAGEISSQLKNTDKLNYTDSNKMKGPISNRFMRLSKHIQKSIVYADSAIKLSNVALCLTTEYIGRTVRDMPILIGQYPYPGFSKIFVDIDVFAKHMFEYVYSFYCMNTKLGVFHGDLHMNNVTMFRLYYMIEESTGKAFIENPGIAYIVNDDSYSFPHHGIFSGIIDFSRSIIGDYSRLLHEFGKNFADAYFHEQRMRTMRIMYSYFPRIMEKYREPIESLLVTKFPLMFKILTAIDSYVISSNMYALLNIDENFKNGSIRVPATIPKLVLKISQAAESLISNLIQSAIDGEINEPADIEYPNLTILTNAFDRYKVTADNIPPYEIIDVFNSNNDVVYEVEDYDTWGPLLSIDYEIKLRKKYKVEDIGIKEWLKFKNSNEDRELENIISTLEKEEKDLIPFESWMLV